MLHFFGALACSRIIYRCAAPTEHIRALPRTRRELPSGRLKSKPTPLANFPPMSATFEPPPLTHPPAPHPRAGASTHNVLRTKSQKTWCWSEPKMPAKCQLAGQAKARTRGACVLPTPVMTRDTRSLRRQTPSCPHTRIASHRARRAHSHHAAGHRISLAAASDCAHRHPPNMPHGASMAATALMTSVSVMTPVGLRCASTT
jgi:hypothetical protein